MDDTTIKQAILVPSAIQDPNTTPERLALFEEDGTPVSFESERAANALLYMSQADANLAYVNKVGGNAVLDCSPQRGIQVDLDTPSFPWRDLIGDVSPKFTGANAPTRGELVTNVYGYFFGAGNQADLLFHIPHDYLPGSDLFIHTHWSHNGTAISGNLVVTYNVTYAKGHNQANFASAVSPTLTVAAPDVVTIPALRHRVDEIQLSAASPSVTQLDTDDIEVDGLIIIGLVTTTIPTITGSSTGQNKPCLHTVDIHYQSTGVGTKEKAPNFYGLV